MRREGRRGPRRRLALLVAPLVALAVLAVAPAAAHADGNYTTYVDGIDGFTNDWGDNPELCNGCSNSYNTDVVTLWQVILFVDGFLAAGQIDGQFGPTTADRTRQWQSWKTGLKVDGRVGPNTWGKADDRLTQLHDNPTDRVDYPGRYGSAMWLRGDGTYSFYFASATPGCGAVSSLVSPTAVVSTSTVAKTHGVYVTCG